MLHRIKLVVKTLFGITTGRSVTVFPDDVFIVSYPKSGNTWVRFLVANVIHQTEPVTFADIEQKVPDIYRNNDRHLLRIPRPRILKSHELFDPRYKKVIYIVRDPRDVIISYYHYHIKVRFIEDGYPMNRYLLRFISGELSSFGSWGENVGGWMGARQNTNGFLLIRYEDLIAQPIYELRKITSFLGINANDGKLGLAIKLSSAENMRKLEKKQAALWKTTKNSRKDKYFVRSARVGGWQTELQSSLAKEIESAWGKIMGKLCYCL